MNAQGFSNLLVTSYNDRFKATNFIYLISRIMVEGRAKDIDEIIKLVNLQAPYKNQLHSRTI